MKYTITAFALLGVGSLAFGPALSAGTPKSPSAPVVITRPAIPDGSNFSRAPFPASRPQNDVTPPNGEAIDLNVPPNTPATTPEPYAPPPAAIAILQPRTNVEPGLMPTGRPTTGAAVALDATRVEPSIRVATFENRSEVLGGLRNRLQQTKTTLAEFRRTENEMSAEGRTQFKSAMDEVKSREKALDKSLRAAERASSSEWDAARAQLVADYDAYAAAVARIDAAAGIAPVR